MILGLFPTAPALVIIAAFGLYAFFSGGPGILQWLYPNELFPTSVRASAVGVSIAISRLGTIAATYSLPIMLSSFGVGPTMLCASGLFWLVWCFRLSWRLKQKESRLLKRASCRLLDICYLSFAGDNANVKPLWIIGI